MVKYTLTGSENYAARIVKVRTLIELPGLSNLKGLPVDGFNSLVPATTPIGSMMAVFPSGAALTEEFAGDRNLFRHTYDFESAIVAVWRNHRATTTRIGPLVHEVCVTIATRLIYNEETLSTQNDNERPTESTGRSPSPRAHLLPEPLNGERRTLNESKKLKSDTESSIGSTKGHEGRNSLPSNDERTPEKTSTPGTVSLPNGMTSDTLTLEDVANFVMGGGKFSALTTAMTQEWLGGYSVEGVTSLSVDLEIMRRVFATLSTTWNGPKFEDFSRNADKDAKGYLEDSGRVKAIKLRGVVSSALALPVEDDAPEGTLFDTIDGTVVSQKWVNPNAPRPQREGQKKVRVQIELPEHFDSAHYLRNKTLIPQDAHISVSQKVHGTSVRVGRVAIEQPQKWWERLFRRPVQKKFEPVIGSRRVIKFAGNPTPGAVHYYGEGNDIWTQAGLPIAEVIPDGAVVYAEIIGWVGDTPIQSGYTYRHAKGTFSVYVYRVTIGGVDLHWNAVKAFCEQRDLKTVPEMWTGLHSEFNHNWWVDKRFAELGGFTWDAVPLDDESPVDEGVVIRWDGGLVPTVLKLKSPQFYVYEGISADAGKADIEEQESA